MGLRRESREVFRPDQGDLRPLFRAQRRGRGVCGRALSRADPGERTLGLLCRGTDYFTKRPYKHQIQPTVAQIIEKTDETLAAHPVDKIFVATEDEAILAALKAKYGGKLVYVECPRLTAVQGQSVAERGVDRKLNGLYYFASIAILARCDHLIAGKTMATQFIRTMRDTPFETEFYWDLGRYGVDDVGKRGM